MTISSNRLVELAITSDPTAALFGTTWSFAGGDLVSTVDAFLNAEVIGSPGVMQIGDTADLDGNGSYEGTYEGRFNFGGSTFTLGDGSTVTGTINIIEVSVAGVSEYYMISSDSLASALDGADLSSVTFGTNFNTSSNTAGLNFDDAATYDLVCFAQGTQITTELGDRAIEVLKAGDRVLTKDNGYQEIRWIGSRTVPGSGKFAPVTFLPGAVGNSKILRLSQQHRVRISNTMVELFFGCSSALAPAHSLVNGADIFIEEEHEVTFFHFLFDQHELVVSDGVWTESFFPSARTVNNQETRTADEIYSLFPELSQDFSAYGKTALTCLKPWEVKAVTQPF